MDTPLMQVQDIVEELGRLRGGRAKPLQLLLLSATLPSASQLEESSSWLPLKEPVIHTVQSDTQTVAQLKQKYGLCSYCGKCVIESVASALTSL